MRVYNPREDIGDVRPRQKKETTASASVAAPAATANQTAYTPLDNSGNDYAAMVGMSAADRAALEAAQQGWLSTDDPVKKAGYHSEGEAIRAKYNYSGGMDGSQYLPFAEKEEPRPSSSFSYESAPTYTNKYQDLIDQLTGQIVNQTPFSYDAESDPLYQQYKTSYTRGGERAMQDALGQLSARTGGLASSYAGSVSQQTYDSYMSALANKIPELQQLAYEMYQDEGEKKRLNLQMIAALEQGDYAKYQDLLGQYNTDRSFAYGQYRDQIADDRYADETAYNRGIYSDETDYNRGMARAQLLAQSGDFSGYEALGYSEEEIKRMQAAFLLEHPEYASLYQSSGDGTGINSGSYLGVDSMGNTIYYNNGVGTYSDGTPYIPGLPYSGGYNYGGITAGSGYSSGTDGAGTWNKWADAEDWVARYGADSINDYLGEHYKNFGYKSKSTAIAGWKNHLTEMGGSIGGGSGGYSSSGGGGGNDSGSYSAGTWTPNAQTGPATPSSEKAITSLNQLSPAAKQIMNHVSPDANYTKERVIEGLEKGVITEAEAQYLMRMVGYEF